MIMVFILVSFDEQVQVADYVVPGALGFILLFSGFYQYFREGWRVSPIVWIIAIILLIYAGYIVYMGEIFLVDPILFGFVATVIVILMGTLTNES
jgi:membrane-bound ClpP family serine protease